MSELNQNHHDHIIINKWTMANGKCMLIFKMYVEMSAMRDVFSIAVLFWLMSEE